MARDAQDDLRITDQFDLRVFWAEHGKKVAVAVGVIAVVGLVIMYWQHQSAAQVEQAAESLARARDVTMLEQVAREYPDSPTAAAALFRLADLYYRNAKYAEARSTYERIAKSFPSHPLASSAKLSIAAILEAQGNLDAAGQQYFQLANTGQGSYLANAARMGLGRCYEAQGKKKEARQVYEEVMAAGQNAPWFNQAYIRWVVLNRDVPPEKPQPSAATPLTAPAPSGLTFPSQPIPSQPAKP
jgi:predicted negative regulator of RcsB-dependent stress response